MSCVSPTYTYIACVHESRAQTVPTREYERVGESDDETSFSYFDIAVITAATCKGVVVVNVCVYLCVLI